MKIVFFAGGAGTRLWPLSRKNSPKQFGKIIGDKTMLQLAVGKLFPEFEWKDIFISTGKIYEGKVREQLPELLKENLIIEPEMRDVGPAVGLIASLFAKEDPREPIALLWGSDHLVKKENVFRKALKLAEEIILKDPEKIILIGQKPRFANQNIGHISLGQKLRQTGEIDVFEFTGFQYRPDLPTAEKYIRDAHHVWNLGYFVTTPKFLWGLFKQFAPVLHKELEKIQKSYKTESYDKTLAEIYPTLKKISFDNAILEKMNSKDAQVLSVDIGWSDIGAWDALKEAFSKTTDENATKGKVIVTDSRDSLLFNFTDSLVAGIDLDEMLVINTNDVVLVCPKNSVPKIKKLVEGLKDTPNEYLM
jgi:mannose-1-phosphate guanylyltransferase